MIRVRNGFDESKIERFCKEGRGRGKNAEYKPWLTTLDVTSLRDRKSKVVGAKSQRLHHLFTDLECNAVTIIDWSDRVVDIRERYPLDQKLIASIAAECGIKLPTDKSSGTVHVFYTDLYISMADGQSLARSVRHSTELAKKAVLDILEVERRYWEHVGRNWAIITECDIDDVHLHNVKFGRFHTRLGQVSHASSTVASEQIAQLLAEIATNPDDLIKQICERLDLQWKGNGQALSLLKHLVGTRVISCSPDVKLSTSLLAQHLFVNRPLK